MPSTSSVPFLPAADAARRCPSLRDAILAGRRLLRADRSARRVAVEGFDAAGRVVSGELRSADGPLRNRRVVAVIGVGPGAPAS